MIHVVCFYWQGDRWQERDYKEDKGYHNTFLKHLRKVGQVAHDLPARYVNNLYKGIERFATEPFKFICFTNEKMEGLDENIEVRSFAMITRKGVLPRVYMFSKEAGLFGNQVFCLDLDVVIINKLTNFFNYRGLFCTRTNFHPANQRRMDGDIMSFQAGEETESLFWKPFQKDPLGAERITMGRERFWLRHCGEKIVELWDDYAPDEILSFKRHIQGRRKQPPKTATIISCHGYPRPHQIRDKWIKEYWK